MMDICPQCGVDRAMVGLAHRCIARPNSTRASIMAAVTKPAEPTVTKPTHVVTKPAPVVTKPKSVVTKPKNKGGRPKLGDQVMTDAERMRRYRARKAGAKVNAG